MDEKKEFEHLIRIMRRIAQGFSFGMPRLSPGSPIDTKAAAYDLGEAVNSMRQRISSLQQLVRMERWERIPPILERIREAMDQIIGGPGFEIFLGERNFRSPLQGRPNEVELEDLSSYYDALRYLESLYFSSSKLLISISPDLSFEFIEDGEREDEPIDIEADLAADHAAEIRKIVPDQSIGPVRFDIFDGRLVVSHQKASNSPDSDIASSARKALVETGQAVIDKLRETNCDRRMLDVVVNLQEKLLSQQDIVELGVFNISCEVVAAKFENELPDVVGAMLLAHSRGISGYVAQFPEWQRFTENAASAELSSTDVRRLHENSGQLVEQLEKNPEIADPEVPKTLELLRTLIADPTSIPKRAGYALLITLENLWSRVYGYAAEFFDATIKKTIAISATAVAITLVSIAAANALDLVPVTSKLADSAWVQTATKIIRRQLEELAKGAEKTE